jgi:hypothetical protein
MSIRNLEYLFQPKSVAVIGASRRPSSVGAVVMQNLLQGGFAGPVLPGCSRTGRPGRVSRMRMPGELLHRYKRIDRGMGSVLSARRFLTGEMEGRKTLTPRRIDRDAWHDGWPMCNGSTLSGFSLKWNGSFGACRKAFNKITRCGESPMAK